MKFLALLALLCCLVIVSVHSHLLWSQENQHDYTFNDFILEFNRRYENQEEFYLRKELFENNLAIIKKINSDPASTWKAGVNQFTDKSEQEKLAFRGHKRQYNIANGKIFNRNLKSKSISELPKSFDWRQKGVVSKVKDQKACGSCWAFSVIATVESHVAIKEGLTGVNIPSYSEQHLVDCAPNPHHCGGTGGCEGSDQPLGFDQLRKNGMRLESEYAYNAVDQICQEASYHKAGTIEAFGLVTPNDTLALMNALVEIGPISISLDATSFDNYESGVINGDCGSPNLSMNHAVVLVGYGEDDTLGKYWIVRNSWSDKWGEEGYVRIARQGVFDTPCYIDTDPFSGGACDGAASQAYVCGTCGILSSSSYPIGGKIS